MVRINLRPWREERNVAMQQKFLTNLLAVALFAGGVIVAGHFYIDYQKQRQNDRNSYLKTEISKLDKKIEEIKELKRQRERLLERLNAIQELQGNRPVIVRNFDELVRVLPDDLYYSSLARSGESIAITGLAQANKDVSNLMRNLDSSIWFGEPNLTRVGDTGQAKSFNLTVPMRTPTAEERQK